MVADGPEFDDRDSLEAWLRDKPADWAQAIAVRSALRVFAVVLAIARLSDRLISAGQKKDLILIVWRASIISWAARKYPAHDMIDAARAAAAATTTTYAATRTDHSRRRRHHHHRLRRRRRR
ncbi:hypothetical protein [Hoeflea sp. EC-HK425]|uniref:hypothetical protein n=1 Tax=Hoeflea sp. EC-HK425 TaxID=2038388 RepID=UPI0012528782|nr:hypothetical protein [Hoeflea sp. EC-HK425]VVT04754.1 hypothetical protein HOE425_320227 [Hoeflea sp. EC-HK425]